MLHPIAGRYPIAVTLPIAVTFSMIHLKMIVSELFSLYPSVVITFLHKFVRKYSRYYLSFLEKLLCGIMPYCFRLTFHCSTEHYYFWNSALKLSLVPLIFSLSVWIKTTLHWTFSFIFTTIVVPVSTGKFPRAWSWVQCSHTKSTLALTVLKLSIFLSMKFLVFQLGLGLG